MVNFKKSWKNKITKNFNFYFLNFFSTFFYFSSFFLFAFFCIQLFLFCMLIFIFHLILNLIFLLFNVKMRKIKLKYFKEKRKRIFDDRNVDIFFNAMISINLLRDKELKVAFHFDNGILWLKEQMDANWTVCGIFYNWFFCSTWNYGCELLIKLLMNLIFKFNFIF